MTGIIIKRGNLKTHTHTHTTHTHGEHHVKMKAGISVMMLLQAKDSKTASNLQTRGEGWNRFPLTASEGINPADTLI